MSRKKKGEAAAAKVLFTSLKRANCLRLRICNGVGTISQQKWRLKSRFEEGHILASSQASKAQERRKGRCVALFGPLQTPRQTSSRRHQHVRLPYLRRRSTRSGGLSELMMILMMMIPTRMVIRIIQMMSRFRCRIASRRYRRHRSAQNATGLLPYWLSRGTRPSGLLPLNRVGVEMANTDDFFARRKRIYSSIVDAV